MKHARKTGQAKDAPSDYRTAIIPVALKPCDYQRAHDAAHKSALIWNELVQFQKNYWDTLKTDPSIQELRDFVYTLDPSLRELHSHIIAANVRATNAGGFLNGPGGNRKSTSPIKPVSS